MVINADLRKSVLSVQTIKTLWKNKTSVVSFVVQALTNTQRCNMTDFMLTQITDTNLDTTGLYIFLRFLRINVVGVV